MWRGCLVGFISCLWACADTAGILEAAYAFGVAAGILLFFNPFVSAAKRKAPSPVEIEMEKYESDIRDTIVKIDNRLNKR